jgi:ankyrin repeat protein
MKFLKIAFVAAGLAVISTPIAAQMGSDSYQFLEAVKKDDGPTGARLVEQHPTIINAKDSKGDTALIIAIARSDPKWTAYLLNNGADPNVGGAGGDTPLIAAARVGFEDAVDWLIDMRAKVDATNRMGETPLIVAVQKRDRAMVKRLLEAGADPDHTDSAAGYSARDYANRDSRSRDIQKLISDKKPKASASAN